LFKSLYIKRLKRFLIFLTCLPLLAQAQFTDDFSDGDFSNSPQWQGDVAKFEVDAGFELHLNDVPQTSTATLYTSSQAIYDASWSFHVRMTFDPSTSNFTRVYLASDASDFNGTLNGYYVQIGGQSGALDDVRLYRQDGNTSVLLIDGVDGTVASEPEVQVVVTHNSLGVWELSIDTFASGVMASQGTATDTTHQFSLYSGVFCDYTSTRSDKFWFDDFVVTGSGLPDLAAPTLISILTVNQSTISLSFNEPLDQASAQVIGNYSANNSLGQPQTATLSNGDSLVTLTFSSNFVLATNYTLTVNGVEDLAGNAVSNQSEQFAYLVFDTPSERDVVINEIFADPTPVVGLPEAEFIELFNAGTGVYNLSEATISDASSTATIPTNAAHFIAPNEYVVICDIADTALFAAYQNVIGVPSLPALNNGGDDVILTIDTVIIDKVSYSSSWYQDGVKAAGGYTLELINPETPCSGSGNWLASNDPSGGTPGAQNSVYSTAPDVTAPLIKQVRVISLNELEIEFSESVDSLSVLSANISLSNGSTIDSIRIGSAFAAAFTVFVSPTIDSATIYTLTISGASDCAGNALLNPTFDFGIGASPAPFDIVINEVYPAPGDGTLLPEAEFVEIYNRSDKLLRLEGMSISDASTSSSLDAIVLFPKSYAIICDDNNGFLFDDSVRIAEVGSLPSLNNAGDVLTLWLGGAQIDQLVYTDDQYAEIDLCCTTLERKNPDDLCSTSGNWAPSVAALGGTPGYKNSQFSSESTAFDLLTASVVSLSQIEFEFTGKTDSNSLKNATVNIGNVGLQFAFANASFSEATFSSNQEFERGSVYEITITGINDCAGYAADVFSTEVYLHQQGDVILNEVLFNPSNTGSDFVELKNNTAYSIGLGNWSFGYYNTDDSLIYLPFELSNIAVDEYLALTESPAKVLNDYPAAVQENLVLTDLPSLSNDDGSVMIFDQFYELMDQFDYNEVMHFALLDDADGVSLERISSTQPTNDGSNWHSASSAVNYATPGYENSQNNEAFSAETQITLSSEFVSPDNDGYQDIVGILYNLTDPGFSISVKVFNDKGFEVKTVASNLLIGASGTINWDGTNDLGEKATIGIHIVHVSLFDLKGNREDYRLPVVVSGKL
jgi:hypothetical protein